MILGAVAHYDFTMVRPFIATLSQSGYDGDTVFFCSDISSATYKKLISWGVKLVPFRPEFPYVATPDLAKHNRWSLDNLPMTFVRFLLAYAFLREHGARYDYVMFSDVRDIIFQKDPFAFPMDDSLCFFAESERMTIANSPINAEWVKEGLGPEALLKIGHNPIICGGTFIGSTRHMLDFLEILLDAAARHFKALPVETKTSGGIEQGFLNYLVYTGAVPFARIFQNNDGPIFTLGHESKIDFNPKTKIVKNAKGLIPNVVHQYDRHLDIAKYYWPRFLFYRHLFKVWRNNFSPSFSARTPRMYNALKLIRDFVCNLREKYFRRNQKLNTTAPD